MSSDPVILDVLASTCKEELQLFEQVVLVFDGEDDRRGNLCIGKHFIYFVNRELDKLLEGREMLSYLDIERAVSDTSTLRFFLLELNPQRRSHWKGGNRILVQSEHRELLLQRIGLCWQAELMYRLFEVRKFPQAKAAIGEQLPGVQSLMSKHNDLVKVEPYKGYEADYTFRGYSFWLRQGFKSLSGLKDGTFHHDKGWEVTYNAQPVVIPPGVRIVFQVDDERLIMDMEKSSTGMENLRTMAMEYQRALTENLDHFYVAVSGQYMKKMNRTDDIAAWDGWEFFIRSKEYAFACVFLRRQYIPPLCSTSQDIGVVLRCPAQNMTNDSCEVILDECRFVADSVSSIFESRGLYRFALQSRLDTLHFNEDGYRWAEGQLGMVPVHKRAALKFVKSIAQILISEGAVWDETLEQAEVFKGVPTMHDPLLVPQELQSEAESLVQVASDRVERRAAWMWRISRYFAYCLDGGIMGERFTFAMLLQSFGRASFETDQMVKRVVEFLLHVSRRGDNRGWGAGFATLWQEPEEFAKYNFNELVMRQLLSENFIANEMKKRAMGSTAQYEAFLASLLDNENVGLGLQTMICRQMLDTLGNAKDEGEHAAQFAKTARNLIPALVKVMRGSNHILMSYATAALVNLSSGRQNIKQLLVSSGVLSLCVGQLKIKHDDLTLYTLYLLVNLTKTPHHRYIVVKEGAIPLLVDILTSSYQNLRKQRILAEVASVIGQLCNDPETRSLISSSFPVLPCLLWVNDSAPPNTKLKSKLLFALRQLCMLGRNKIKVGQHIIPVLLEELGLASSGAEECVTNLVLLLISLATVNSHALMMFDQIDVSLESCGIQKDGMQAKNNKLAAVLWPKVESLKTRIMDARAACGEI